MFFYRPEPVEPVGLRVLGDGLDVTLVLAGVILVSLMFVNVLSRSILNADIAWNTEFGEFVLSWATFIGCAAAARRNVHMRIGELVEKLAANTARVVDIVVRLLIASLLIAIVVKGCAIVVRTWDQEMSVLYWPVGLQYLAMPVGAALTLVYVLRDVISVLRNVPSPSPDPALSGD